LGAIKTPVVKYKDKWVINKEHRFFYDDIYYGLCIAKWIAEQMNLEVRTIDTILKWAEVILNDKILCNNKLTYNEKSGAFSIYNYNSLDEIIK
jgi:hypothetical protein